MTLVLSRERHLFALQWNKLVFAVCKYQGKLLKTGSQKNVAQHCIFYTKDLKNCNELCNVIVTVAKESSNPSNIGNFHLYLEIFSLVFIGNWILYIKNSYTKLLKWHFLSFASSAIQQSYIDKNVKSRHWNPGPSKREVNLSITVPHSNLVTISQ